MPNETKREQTSSERRHQPTAEQKPVAKEKQTAAKQDPSKQPGFPTTREEAQALVQAFDDQLAKRAREKEQELSIEWHREQELLAQGKRPRLKITGSGRQRGFAIDWPNARRGAALLMEAIGTTDEDFLNGILTQIANAGSGDGYIGEQELNFILSAIKGMKPKDQTEAMLAAQMATRVRFQSLPAILAGSMPKSSHQRCSSPARCTAR